jgi:hypothetical protein
MNLDAGYLLRNLRLMLLLVLALAGALPVSGQVVTGSSGRDFWVALPSLAAAPAHIARLNIVAVQGADVTVTLNEDTTILTRSLTPGELWEVVLLRDRVMLDLAEYTSSRTIHITSTQPVTAQLISDAIYVSEAYCALPTPSLGFEYLVMSAPSVGYPANEANNFGGVLAVIATQDSTSIRVTPTEMTTSGNPAGFAYTVSLKRGEVYQMLPLNPNRTDLTGTRITSNKPIAVLSGHRFLEYDSTDASNPLLEQMVPVIDWGRKFYGAPLPKNLVGHYRILASRAGTEIFFDGLRVATLGAGEDRRFAYEGPVVIRASAPVLVAQHTTSFPVGKGEPDGDPSMMLLNPVESFTESFMWGTSAIAPRLIPGDTIYVPFPQYVMITAPTADRSSVRLDGAPVNFTINYSDGAYYSAVAKLDPGSHQLTAPNPINAQLYGYGLDDAYSMPAGVRLRDPFRAEPLIARTCQTVLDTTILVTNVGTEQIDIIKIEFSPGISGTVVFPDFLPINILPVASQALRLRINLPNYGLDSGTVTLTTSTSGARPLVVPIEIVRDSLAIITVERDIVFDDVTVARPTRDTVIRVVNTGTGPVMLSSASFTGPFTVISPSLPVWIGEGDTLALTVRFAPLGPGMFDGKTTITPAPCGTPASVTLHGERLSPAEIAADVATDTVICPEPGYSDIPLTIRNAGGEPLRIDSIGISGVAAMDYSFPVSPNGLIVQPNDLAVVALRFAPTAIGPRPAELRIWNRVSPSGNFFLPVSAQKDSFGISVSQPEIDFGILNGCQTAEQRTITIRNTGGVPVRIDSIKTSTGDFSAAGSVITLPAGASGDLVVHFTPKQSGIRRDTLYLVDALCHTRIAVPLSGEQQAAGFTVDKDTLDFGVVPACNLPLTRLLRITNSGAVEERLTSIAISGGGATVGAIGDSTLAPSESLDVPVTLAVQPDGTINAVVTVRVEPCGLEREVVVRGVVQTPGIAQPATVDFGEITPGTPMHGETMVINSGDLPLRLDSIGLVPSVAGLRITAPTFPVEIAPGDTLTVAFEYLTEESNGFSTIATAYINAPCAIRSTFTVRGTKREIVLLRLVLPDTSASVDGQIRLPVTITGTSNIEGNLAVSGEIAWNYSMLHFQSISTPVPNATVAMIRDTVMGTERTVSFSYTGPVPQGDILVTLDVLVLLGLNDVTPLRWRNVEVRFDESLPRVETRDGQFTTLGICRIGGNRYIRLNGITSVSKIVPNPATTTATLDITSAEATECELVIFDRLGRQAGSTRSLTLMPGAQQIEINVSSLATGSYFYELRAENRIERGQLVVVR